MQSAIAYLQDAETVAKFQRLCGVVKLSELNGRAEGRHRSGDNGKTSNQDTVSRENSNGNVAHRTTGVSQHLNENGGGSKAEKSTSRDWIIEDYVVRNRFLYYLFHFGANLGNEIFYMTFFPFWFWNIDGCVGRQLCMFWCIFMYFGQASKDIIQIPRPASPPVIQMEKRYALEYGMPSTHAMVGAGIPFAIFFLTKERYIYHNELALIGAIAWCLLVACSRIYLGMHSVLDVIAGLLFISFLMAVVLPYLGAIDNFLIHSMYAPIICIVLPITMCLMYPTPNRWSTARGDTTLIVSSAAGVTLGHWLSYQLGFMQKSTSPPPYDIIPPTWTWAGLIVLRMSIGVSVLLVVRYVVGTVVFRIVCLVMHVDHRDRAAAKQLWRVDLPYKFVTYATLSVGMVYAAPVMFRALGIERETFFTEI